LTNPAAPSRQIVGVPRPDLTELLARALLLLGATRAWVVHGADGLDELSTTGYTKVSECREGSVQTFYVHPSEYGLAKASPDTLRGGDAETNAAIVRSVLDGALGPPRDIVLLNAGAALFIAGRASSVRDGIGQAAEAIDSGRAKQVLAQLVTLSHSGAGATARRARRRPICSRRLLRRHANASRRVRRRSHSAYSRRARLRGTRAEGPFARRLRAPID
jgi:anthranilate phosphoribosyltransferase